MLKLYLLFLQYFAKFRRDAAALKETFSQFEGLIFSTHVDILLFF